MNNALRGNGLYATDRMALEQCNTVSGLSQAGEGPEAGYAAAENGDVEAGLLQGVFVSRVI